MLYLTLCVQNIEFQIKGGHGYTAHLYHLRHAVYYNLRYGGRLEKHLRKVHAVLKCVFFMDSHSF